jgi:DNA repair photolyase
MRFEQATTREIIEASATEDPLAIQEKDVRITLEVTKFCKKASREE